ncbi:exocyst complex component Sec5-domain-containing protein [Entophlyctis helioformis]|nr:exocyst complex component Sec5-domain-containing protein [Entophlyctis helioformis]
MADTAAKKGGSAASTLSRVQTAGMTAKAQPSTGSKLKQQIVPSRAINTQPEEEADDGDDDDDDGDDDDDDDDDNDDAVDASSQKKGGIKSSGDTSKWSADEQSAVLDFYGLDTLFPQKWVELPGLMAQSLNARSAKLNSQGGNGGGSAASTPLKATLGQDASSGLQLDTTDPLGIRDSILRRGKRRESTKPTTDSSERSIFISDKHFDAAYFLREVHKQASYKELEQGASRLKVAIEQRDEVIKGLVKKHFAKFVNAKTTIDSFYREMRQKNLISSSEYGIAPFAKALDNLEINANKLYGPVLGRRSNGDKIRIALSILEGWKFFFNLPSSVSDQIKKISTGKDVTRQDTKKEPKDSAGLLPKTHRAVFDKVWAEVDQIVTRLRDELFVKLGDPSHSLEAQEKIIGYLVDLDAERSPAWCFLESQYIWLANRLKECYKTYILKLDTVLSTSEGVRQSPQTATTVSVVVSEPDSSPTSGVASADVQDAPRTSAIDAERRKSTAKPQDPAVMNSDVARQDHRRTDLLQPYELKKGLACVSSQNFEHLFRFNTDAQAWKLTLRFVQELCSVLCSRLPDICKICKTYVEGKLHKVKIADSNKKTELNRRASRVQHMISNIFKLVSSILTDAFGLRFTFTDINGFLGKEPLGRPPARDAALRFSVIARRATSVRSGNPTSINSSTYPDAAQADESPGMASNDTEDASNELLDSGLDIADVPFKPARLVFLIAHPLVAAHYATKIASVFGQMYGEIRAIGFLAQEESLLLGLSFALVHVQSRVVESICEAWLTTSAIFHVYEDWTYEANTALTATHTASVSNESTTMVKLFHRLNKFVVRVLGYIHSVILCPPSALDEGPMTTTAATPMSSRGYNPSSSIIALRMNSLDNIRFAFFESQYLFLDGLQWLATHYRQSEIEDGLSAEDDGVAGQEPWAGIGSQTTKDSSILFFGDTMLKVNLDRKLRENNVESRCFVVLGNLAYMKGVSIRNLSALFETKMQVQASSDIKNLYDTVDYLDNLLIQNYVRRQTMTLQKLLQSGILFSGLDWASVGKPQDVRQYCYRILLHLVLVHASISDVSKLLVRRVMTEMLHSLAGGLLMAYRSVDKFSTGGMLQATVETEFLYDTLKTYETQQTASLIAMVYDSIERSTINAEIAAAVHNDMLHRVKMSLDHAKKSTGVQFQCFREGIVEKRSNALRNDDYD